MRRNELLWAGLVFAAGALAVTYTALAGISFNGATFTRIWRTATDDTPLDPNGTIYVIPFKCGAAPAAAQNLYHESDGNNYNSRRLAITRTTSGKISVLYNTTGAPDSNDTLVDPNLAQLVTVWAGPKSLTDPNAKIMVWLNGYAVKPSTITTAAISDANMHTISFGSAGGLAAGAFTGELENPCVIYATDPNVAAAVHTAFWNSGVVLDPNAVSGYTFAHRWKFTGGTPSAPVGTTDVWIDDSGTVGGMDCNVTTTDGNFPTYTAQWGLFPTTLIVADSNNVTFTGPCVGPWTGGLTYAVTGDANWTATPLDANDTWWSATDASGSGAGTAQIALTADANALGFGTYTSTIVFANTDTGGLGGTTRTITLVVFDASAVDLTDPNGASGYTWTFPYASAGDGNSFVVGITNNAACEAVVNVSVSDTDNWTLGGVDPNSCSDDGSGGFDCNVPAGDNIAVTLGLDPNVMPTMPIGLWASVLRFKANDDSNDWTSVPLAVLVTTGAVGDPNAREFAFTESSDMNNVDSTVHTVNYTLTGPSDTIVFTLLDPNGLALIGLDGALCTKGIDGVISCPMTTDGNQAITLALDPNVAVQLAAGVYNYTFAIHPDGDANSPTTVPVTITVSPAAGGDTRYVSAEGNDYIDGGELNNCLIAGAPCGTIDHAYDELQDGDTASVAAGLYWIDGDSVLHADRDIAVAFVGPGATWRNSTTSEPTVLIQTATAGGVTLNGLTLDALQNGLVNGSCIRQTASGVDLTLANVTFLPPAVSDFAVYATAGDVVTLQAGCRMVPAALDTKFLSVSGASTVIESLSGGGQKIIIPPQ